MRQIAAKTGVSHVTVSLALRNDPRLPVGTRLRIQQIARDMGYRPNPLVHALMAQVRVARPVERTSTLAYLTTFPTRDGCHKVSHIYREYFQGASERASELGYRLEKVWAKEPGMTGRRLTQVLRARNIRGLIIGPLPPAFGHLSLDWSQFASAALGYSLTRPDLHRASANHLYGMQLALRKLRRLGYRRIGFVTSRAAENRVGRVHLGTMLAFQLTSSHQNRVPPLLMKVNWDPKACRAWWHKHRPDAVIAIGAMIARDIQRFGVRVPEDVAVVSLMWTAERIYCAGINQNARLVGSAAVDLVNGLLQRNEFGIPAHPKLVLIKGDWVDGPTVRSR